MVATVFIVMAAETFVPESVSELVSQREN